ncbi:MAG TPA: hypothetical protein VHR43_14965, partial [Gemmatimonadales bacterium]|nr:hypothetical protein [Gemmatimonadales bacterium]
AADALARLAASADSAVPRDHAARLEQYQDICVVQTWRLTHGDTRTARAAIARLADADFFGCHVMLAALLAAAEHRPDAGAAYGRLDSLLLLGGKPPGWVVMAAKWHEAQGDTRVRSGPSGGARDTTTSGTCHISCRRKAVLRRS